MKRLSHLATPKDCAPRARSPFRGRPLALSKASGICGGALFWGLLSLVACRPSSENQGASNVNVVNGSGITSRDSAMARSVFHLNVLDETMTNVEKSCTAAAISENVVIVAAHCLPYGENISGRLKIEGKNASIKQIIGAESLYEQVVLSEQDAAMDLAAVVLESSGPVFSSQEIATIAPTSSTPGSTVKMIGFGATDLDALKNPGTANGTGQAAIGSQKILSADGSTYEFRATQKDLINPKSGVSIAAPGDSGAPLFNADGQLIGLLVGLSYHNAGQPLDLSQDLTQIAALADKADSYGNKAVDLRSPAAQKIIQIALGHAVGTISYEATSDQPTPFLAICRKNRDKIGGSRRDEGGERVNSERFGGRDLADLLDRFRGSGRDGIGGSSSGSNRNNSDRNRNGSSTSTSTGNRSGNSTGNRIGSNSKLSDQEIKDILNDL